MRRGVGIEEKRRAIRVQLAGGIRRYSVGVERERAVRGDEIRRD
jgi:hypothetical protein